MAEVVIAYKASAVVIRIGNLLQFKLQEGERRGFCAVPDRWPLTRRRSLVSQPLAISGGTELRQRSFLKTQRTELRMPKSLAVLFVAFIALASAADAQISGHGKEKAATLRSHKADRGGSDYAPTTRPRQDCPSGDCRGVNSTGGLGGSPSDF